MLTYAVFMAIGFVQEWQQITPAELRAGCARRKRWLISRDGTTIGAGTTADTLRQEDRGATTATRSAMKNAAAMIVLTDRSDRTMGTAISRRGRCRLRMASASSRATTSTRWFVARALKCERCKCCRRLHWVVKPEKCCTHTCRPIRITSALL